MNHREHGAHGEDQPKTILNPLCTLCILCALCVESKEFVGADLQVGPPFGYVVTGDSAVVALQSRTLTLTLYPKGHFVPMGEGIITPKPLTVIASERSERSTRSDDACRIISNVAGTRN